MKITFFDIIGYLFKRKYLIAAITVIAVAMGYFYIEKTQKYSAEVIIKYTDYNAAEGKAPNGEKLDVYEIISPDIVLKALKKMNANIEVESVRSAVSITPIIPVSASRSFKNQKPNWVKNTLISRQYTVSGIRSANQKAGMVIIAGIF